MAFALRLPARLDTSARAHAEYMGISLNALVCVALDAYIRGVSVVPAVPAAVPSPESFELVHTVPPKPDTGGKSPDKKVEKKITYKDRQRAQNTLVNMVNKISK